MATFRRKTLKARTRRPRKNKVTFKTKTVAKIARSVAIKASETKKHIHQINETNINSLNAPHYTVLSDDAYKLQQGDGNSNMPGHHINAIGLKTALYLHNAHHRDYSVNFSLFIHELVFYLLVLDTNYLKPTQEILHSAIMRMGPGLLGPQRQDQELAPIYNRSLQHSQTANQPPK